MTAIFYPDCDAVSDNGRYKLEARSPHNGTIRHRDGRMPSADEFGYKYKEHQSGFRYRLHDRTRAVVVWERWQPVGEDSPHEVVVSDDGWSVLRTHGFNPELIAVAPDGRDAVRIRISGDGSEHHRAKPPVDDTPRFDWPPDRLQFTTAGLFWTGHSWRYFVRLSDGPAFVWRTWWGQRLVLDLGRGELYADTPPDPLDVAEGQGALALLGRLSGRMADIQALLHRRSEEYDEHDPLLADVRRVSAALHLIGVHRVLDGVPFLRQWEEPDVPSCSTGSSAMPDRWWLETQLFRPIVCDALKRLGERPAGRPTYHFTRTVDGDRERRFPMPDMPPDRRQRFARLRRRMSAEEVLRLLGSPDFIGRHSRREGQFYRSSEDWEYDEATATGWTTIRITWEETARRGRIASAGRVDPYWLDSDERRVEFLDR